jgi:hypothetical protein
VLTSLSTLRAARDKRRQLVAYQSDFYRQAAADAARDTTAAFLVGDGGDPARGAALVDTLLRHGVEVRSLATAVSAGGTTFRPGHAWLVPLEQRQSRLVHALFERRTEFADETFYDVSAWTLPLAFDLPAAELPRSRFAAGLAGETVDAAPLPAGRVPTAAPDAPPYAWLVEWTGYYAPRALYRLLAAGVVASVATRPFETESDAGRRRFEVGTVVIPRGAQSLSADEVAALLAGAAADDGVDVYTVTSGLTPAGVDLGSPSLRPLELPRPLLVVGDGVSSYEAGEMWHLLDHRWALPLPLVDRDHLADVDLHDYSHVILVEGRWDDLPERAVASLRRWLRGGGVVIATQGAARWVEPALMAEERGENGGGPPEETRYVEERATERSAGSPNGGGPRAAYADFEKRLAVGLISGAIFETELDLTNPLAFGFSDAVLPVFRDGTRVLVPSENPYENVALYTERPLLAGYASGDNVAAIAGSAAVLAQRVGRGTVVRIADDPAFRGFWYGTDRLVANGLFFGSVVKRTAPLP